MRGVDKTAPCLAKQTFTLPGHRVLLVLASGARSARLIRVNKFVTDRALCACPRDGDRPILILPKRTLLAAGVIAPVFDDFTLLACQADTVPNVDGQLCQRRDKVGGRNVGRVIGPDLVFVLSTQLSVPHLGAAGV
jgi:hypothetical protein